MARRQSEPAIGTDGSRLGLPAGIARAVLERADATIVRADCGGPIRTMPPGRYPFFTGRFSSRKAGRHLPWEGLLEEKICHFCEADPGVVSWMSQPHRLEMRVGTRLLSYFPDFERRLATGQIEVLEAKTKADRRRSDSEYLAKLGAAARIYERLGWRFAIVEEDDPTLAKLEKTVRSITYHRGVIVDPIARLEILGALEKRDRDFLFADLCRMELADEATLQAWVHSLALRRDLTFQFDRPLRQTCLRRVQANETCLLLGTEVLR